MNGLGCRIGRLLLVPAAIIIVMSVSVRADDSAALYKAKCAYCHGTDGKGDTPVAKKMGVRDFASPEVQKETDKELIDITTKGKNKMPEYENMLTKSQIKDLVTYIHALGKK